MKFLDEENKEMQNEIAALKEKIQVIMVAIKIHH